MNTVSVSDAIQTVDPAITAAIADVGVQTLAVAPTMAQGELALSGAGSTGLAFSQSVGHQQRMDAVAQAATTQGLTMLLAARPVPRLAPEVKTMQTKRTPAPVVTVLLELLLVLVQKKKPKKDKSDIVITIV